MHVVSLQHTMHSLFVTGELISISIHTIFYLFINNIQETQLKYIPTPCCWTSVPVNAVHSKERSVQPVYV